MTRRHRLALCSGLTLGALSFLPFTIRLADQRMLFHVLEEMLLLALVVPLIAYGLGPLLRSGLGFRLQPLVGILALNLALFGAQLPWAVNLVVRTPLVHAMFQALFIGAAFLFWWPIIRPKPALGGLSSIAKIGYLMVASVPPTVPGITLAFSHHLFYAVFPSIDDQQLAGLLLFATAKCALVTGTFIILWRMLTPEAEPPDDDGPDRALPGLPSPAPAWYAQLEGPLPAERRPERAPVATP
jgi:cytochrome c oxidase assembly factor CtaG